MTTLKLGPLADERPAKLTIELPAAVLRDLKIYGALLAQSSGDAEPVEPARLIPPMLERFMATDRGFARARKTAFQSRGGASE
ncbi:DUF2274 domain-containing protein [Sphingomonas oligoaromativorans]|uniref:DUF2274 domain-containing protein n=1 Tax=Sphingomonas oligoaromativorans TaxID=575322 RepID=UPI00141D74EB|nr:DUF2274 domain-containing protein [Sphingomonas oligoaromativorans]NIJ34107.1 hypothetical protein [Sphingomonas oligoaromativorans]